VLKSIVKDDDLGAEALHSQTDSGGATWGGKDDSSRIAPGQKKRLVSADLRSQEGTVAGADYGDAPHSSAVSPAHHRHLAPPVLEISDQMIRHGGLAGPPDREIADGNDRDSGAIRRKDLPAVEPHADRCDDAVEPSKGEQQRLEQPLPGTFRSLKNQPSMPCGHPVHRFISERG
jgi:hypothetical protein